MTIKSLKSNTDLQWFNVIKPSAAEIAHISSEAGVEHSDADVILNSAKRPFLEVRKNYAFIYLNLPIFDDKSNTIHSTPLSIIIKDKEIYTFHQGEMNTLKRFFELVNHKPEAREKYLKNGVVDFMPALLRRILLRTLPMIDKISVEIDSLEKRLAEKKSEEIVTDISQLRRRLIDIRRLIKPIDSLIERFVIEDIPFFTRDNKQPYATVKNALDNVWQVIETEKETLDDLAKSHLAVVQNHTNRTIRILTIFSALFLPLNLVYSLFIAQQDDSILGGFSANFGITVLVMFIVGLVTYLIFKRKKML